MSWKDKKTGTTLFVCPYKDGLILAADTRATSPSTMESFLVTTKLHTLGLENINEGCELAVAIAGYANAGNTIIQKSMNTLREVLEHYKIDLNDFKTPEEFLEFYNQFEGVYMFRQLSPIDYQMLNNVVYLLVIKTKNFMFAIEDSILGGNCYHVEDPEGKALPTNLIASGSGGRYILGAAYAENEKNPFLKRSLEDVKKWIIDNFPHAISGDLASSTKGGLDLIIFSKDQKIKKERIL